MATPSQPFAAAIPNSITKQPVDVDSLGSFQKNCLTLLAEDNTAQREEHLKNLLSDFLKTTYFANYAINTKKDIDLAIHADDINCKALGFCLIYQAACTRLSGVDITFPISHQGWM